MIDVYWCCYNTSSPQTCADRRHVVKPNKRAVGGTGLSTFSPPLSTKNYSGLLVFKTLLVFSSALFSSLRRRQGTEDTSPIETRS